jgi:hypothetical protein
MTNGNGSGSLTFKWLVGILIIIIFAVTSIILADTKTAIREAKELAITNHLADQVKIECLEKEKLDKDQYYRDLRDIKATLTKIDEKLDKIKK